MSSTPRDTDADWKRVAETDPYFGVLSEEAYRKDAMDAESHRRFMATGEKSIADLFEIIDRHLVPGFAPRRALDVGCGVGRHLLAIARRADEAVGVDVAPAMLEICRENAAAAGIENITVLENDDTLSAVQGPFDLVNTFFVLQHVPPARGLRILQAMLDLTATGGVVSIELTYARSRRFFFDEEPTAHYFRRDGRTITDLVDTGRQPAPGSITMHDYDLNEVMARFARVAGPMIVLPTDDDSHLGLHFLFTKMK